MDSATYGRRSFQGIPAIARTGKRIWTVWYGDVRVPWVGEAAGNFLILRYSDDGGKAWSRDFYLLPANPATDRAFDPQLWTAPDGKLWVLYAQSGNNQTYDGQFGVWANVITDPLAATPTFEPGFWMADGVPGRPFLMNGQWHIPIDVWRDKPRFPARAGIFLYRLNWQDRTATPVSRLPNGPAASFDETTMVQLRNGQILAQWRTGGGVYQNIGSSNGLSWGTPAPFTAFPTAWSRHILVRSPSGRLIMAFNRLAPNRVRTDLTLAISEDEGLTWPHSVVIDNRHQISYPIIDFDENGDVLVVYDFQRAAGREIVLARTTEANIIAGNATVTRTLASIYGQ
ncbi:sialidase family protein [Sphingomonas sp. CJ99]